MQIIVLQFLKFVVDNIFANYPFGQFFDVTQMAKVSVVNWSVDNWYLNIYHFFAETKILDGAVCIEAKELNSALFSDKPHLVERNDRDRSESTENISLF